MCMSNCRCCHCWLIGWRGCNTRLYCWCQMHWSRDMDNHNIQIQYNIRRRHNHIDMTNNCTYLTTRVPRAYNHFYTKCNPDILTGYYKHIVLTHTQFRNYYRHLFPSRYTTNTPPAAPQLHWRKMEITSLLKANHRLDSAKSGRQKMQNSGIFTKIKTAIINGGLG